MINKIKNCCNKEKKYLLGLLQIETTKIKKRYYDGKINSKDFSKCISLIKNSEIFINGGINTI